MTKCALADALDAGVAADIFYDAQDHQDEQAEATIENFQNAVSAASHEFRIIAELDLTGSSLSPNDLAALRALQARIQAQ